MWRLIVVLLYTLFTSTQATPTPSPSLVANTKSQGQSPARVSEALGAKHGYRYEVQFPPVNKENTISNRYQSEEKDKEVERSIIPIGPAPVAKYTNGYNTVIRSLQDASLPDLHPRVSSANTYTADQYGVSSSAKSDSEQIKMDFENSFNMVGNMLTPFLQPNVHPTTKNNEALFERSTNMYLPPETNDFPGNNKGGGYTYDKPNNQLTLPNENNNHEYSMASPQYHPSIPSSNEDDSVEVFPLTKTPQSTRLNENIENQNYKPNREAQVSIEEYNNYSSIPLKPKEQNTFALNNYNYDKYNGKIFMPIPSTEHDTSFNNVNTFSSKRYDEEAYNTLNATTQGSPHSNSKLVQNVVTDDFKSTRISSSALNSETDDLSHTSLMVHFAGSVFSAEGLPHPSKEMVFPVDYNFSYELRGQPEMGHEETRADTTTRGRYWVGLPDGRLQVVEYTAGPQGFIPRVSYRSRAL